MTKHDFSGNGPDRDSHQPDDQYELAFTWHNDASQALSRRFEEFHAANPHVYRLLVELARDWMHTTGSDKLGVAQLWERMRWDLAVRTTSTDFNLNNDLKPYYARLIMKQERDLSGLFNLRRAAADEWIAERAA